MWNDNKKSWKSVREKINSYVVRLTSVGGEKKLRQAIAHLVLLLDRLGDNRITIVHYTLFRRYGDILLLLR